MTPRGRELLRRSGRVAATVLVLLLLVLAVGEATGWPVLRGPLQRTASDAAGVPVRVQGPFRVRFLWHPTLEAGFLQVGAGGGLELPWLLQGRDVRLQWRWGDLWRWRRGEPLRMDALSAGALDVNLVRDAQGRASWQIGPARPAGTPPREPADLPHIGTLTVADGHARIDDAPLQTRLDLRLEGGERSTAAGQAEGGYRLAAEGRWRALPVQLQARTGGALPLLHEPAGDGPAPALALVVDGHLGDLKVAFDGQAAALLGSRRVDGRLRLSAPSLAGLADATGLTLPQSPPFELQTTLRHDAGVWELGGTQATIGRSRLGGDFRLDGNATPPRLTGTLTGQRLAFADLGPAVGASAPAPAGAKPKPAAKAKVPAFAAPAPAAPASGVRVLPQRRFDLPSLAAMDADVQTTIDQLDFGTDALAPLQGLRTRIVLQGGVLELRELQARSGEGRIAGTTRLDARADPARWGARLRFADVDLARWVRAVARYASGRLEAEVDLAGSGRSTAEILASLDGRALLQLRHGTVSHLVTEAAGLDVAQALGVALRGDERLPMRCARFDLALKDGVVTPRQAVIDNRDSTIVIGGQVDLRDETLGLALRARPKDFSPLALRSPITVTGPLGAPRVGIEGGKLAGRVLGAVVLGALVAPVAALLPLIDPGSGDTGDPCAAGLAGAAPASAPRATQPAR